MVNRVYLLGRLGKDPVLKHFSNDNVIAEFSLATSENYKDKEGKWIEVTDWHNIKLPYKSLAERAEKYLKKGSQVFVEGKIKTRSYEKDGATKYITEIVVDSLRMLDKRTDGAAGGVANGSNVNEPPYDHSEAAPGSNVGDDLPF